MPSLQVLDLPEHIYQKLLPDANSRHPSLTNMRYIFGIYTFKGS